MRDLDAPAIAAGQGLLFDTAFGRCALAWNEHGLTAVRLPGASDAATMAGLPALSPAGSAPEWVQTAVAAMQAHLQGEADDLRQVPLDWSRVGSFERRVHEATRALDPGCTTTYGAIAHTLGEPGAVRAVGQALGHNPWPLVIPCHRVLAAGGRLGGFSAPGGSETKRRLLVLESTMVRREGELF